MYLVTKRIDFCYGHRLLDYDGVCKHPHGHNAVVEVEVRTDRLDNRNMVADFSDIKRVVKGWIEYYDKNMVRVTREGAPNPFIFKHQIMYIAEDTGRRKP